MSCQKLVNRGDLFFAQQLFLSPVWQKELIFGMSVSRGLGWGLASGRHCAAGLRTGFAGLGAGLAMVMFVFAAFVSALLAHVSAQLAHGWGAVTFAGHRRSGHGAQLRAINVKRNALGHGLHISFFQTRSGAIITGHRAGIAGFNAGGIFLVLHGDLSED